MRIASMLLQGTHVTRGGASTRVEGEYSWSLPAGFAFPTLPFSVEPARGVMGAGHHVVHVDNIPSTEGNWGATLDSGVLAWSACNEDGGQNVQLEAALTLRAGQGASGPEAEIALQRSDAGMAWRWMFESCGFSGSWSSTYAVPGGGSVRATLDVHGDHGTYQTASFKGRLFDIERRFGPVEPPIYDVRSFAGRRPDEARSSATEAPDGTRRVAHVHGRWSALGHEGWFDFDVDGDRFDGQWGFSDGGMPAGRWWGQR
jgi:hypothetical protein